MDIGRVVMETILHSGSLAAQGYWYLSRLEAAPKHQDDLVETVSCPPIYRRELMASETVVPVVSMPPDCRYPVWQPLIGKCPRSQSVCS